MVHGSQLLKHTERMELLVLKELLVLGSWFKALETHRENGPDCVQRVASSWFLVHGFGNTQREWT